MKFSPLYVLPNLFTAASGFLGMLSVIYTFNYNSYVACWLIVIALVLDGLDGRVARMTNTSSKFGVEFDSLCDLVAFGVAPSMLLYFNIGQFYGKFGVMVSCIFVVFGAIRLSRFNVAVMDDPKFFIGLPIPSAALFVATSLVMLDRYLGGSMFILGGGGERSMVGIPLLLLIIDFFVGILMVSNIRYPNFKQVKWNLRKFILLLLILGTIFIYPLEGLCILITAYIAFGISRYVYIFISKVIRRSSN